jgi:hypothetical protein
VLRDDLGQAETFIQLANQHQSGNRRHMRSLELDLQEPVERELKWLMLAGAKLPSMNAFP